MTTQERIDKVNKIFNDERCEFTAEPNGFDEVEITIDMGDWKHEHLWAKNLMEFLGYKEIGNKVTEEDGSDCYSAEHYFLKTA